MYSGPGVYRHYKGNYYYVMGLAKHSETHEVLVLYCPLYVTESGLQLTIRPRKMFDEKMKPLCKCERNDLKDEACRSECREPVERRKEYWPLRFEKVRGE